MYRRRRQFRSDCRCGLEADGRLRLQLLAFVVVVTTMSLTRSAVCSKHCPPSASQGGAWFARAFQSEVPDLGCEKPRLSNRWFTLHQPQSQDGPGGRESTVRMEGESKINHIILVIFAPRRRCGLWFWKGPVPWSAIPLRHRGGSSLNAPNGTESSDELLSNVRRSPTCGGSESGACS